MNIQKHALAKLRSVYSITIVPGTEVGGIPSFLAGSEGNSELLYFESPGFKPRVIAREPGGYISLVPMEHGGRHHVIASTQFKPGFNAASSDIRIYPLDRGEMPAGAIVADLPYAHRLVLLQRNGKKYLLGSTLCAAKADEDDWSQPGGVLAAEVPADFSIERHNRPGGGPARWPMRHVFSGMNKNHGFDFAVLGSGANAREGYLVSAKEGLFFLQIPANAGADGAAGMMGAWQAERISRFECSDAFAYDWDGDGEAEIFSISPFHGNVLAMHKRRAPHATRFPVDGDAAWLRSVIHSDLAFGHVVWAGNFLARPGLLAGSRDGRRELRLYRAAADGGVDLKYSIIDEGIGPSQMEVVECSPGRMVLYVAAHGVDEVRVYEVTE